MSRPATPPRTQSPVAALVYCAVLALGVTALGLLVLVAGVVDPTYAGPFITVGLVILTPAALMWVAIVRLVTRPPRGAVLLLSTVAPVGGLVLIVGLAAVQASAAAGVSGMPPFAIAAVGLAYLGGAVLLAAQVFGRSRNEGGSQNMGESQ
jgi:hypothetical protein